MADFHTFLNASFVAEVWLCKFSLFGIFGDFFLHHFFKVLDYRAFSTVLFLISFNTAGNMIGFSGNF